MKNNTLNYYNSHVKDFTSDTIEAKMSDIQEKFLNNLSPGSHILDLGCGSGRDSLLFKKRGYQVTALDGSEELCKSASKLIGQEVICKTFDQLDYKSEFDGIWACASLLHVPFNELEDIFNKVVKALKSKGVFYVSFKYGDFEGERQDRHYTDLTEQSFHKLLRIFNNIKISELWLSDDVRPGREDKWLNAILLKN